MASNYYAAMTTPAISTTGTRERTVSDTIRNLFPGVPFMQLIESGLPNMDGVKQKRGMISKRKVTSTKPEMFTYTPLAVEFTVSAFTSVADFTLSSAAGLSTHLLMLNTNNKTVCRIGTVNVTTGAVTATTIGGTTFTASVNDKLLVLGAAYPENSSSPQIIMKDEDNLYNHTQIMRFAGAISNTAGGNPHYGGSFWGRLRERVTVEGLRRASHNMLFAERASSGETTTDSILSDSVRTMRGLWHWAATSYNAQGNMTWEKFRDVMPLEMSDTIDPSKKQIMLCGIKVWADILSWQNDAGIIRVDMSDYGKDTTWGVKSMKIMHARGEVEVIHLDVFDRGDLYKNALIFCPDEVEYLYKNKGPGDSQDRDFHPKKGIQNNDVDGVEDEILGEISMGVLDGGNSIHKIENWL